MNVILEGPDAAGKTTLAEKLQRKYGMTTHHSTSRTRNDLHYHIDLLDYRTNTVFDRFHLGEYVYPIIYNRSSKLTTEESAMIDKRIIDNNDLIIVFTTSNMEIINERLRERGETNYIPEMTQQNELFTEAANKFSTYNYKNFYVIDIAEPGAYDKLDAWIDERMSQAITTNIAYKRLCNALLDDGHTMETRNVRGNTKELCNYSFVVNDLDCEYISLATGGTNLTYLAAELLWYWSARNDLKFIGNFSKVWDKVTDDGETANSAYGYILQKKHGFNQIDKMVELLKKDPYSRRAVMNINVPNENVIDTHDEMCTICLNYQIRQNKLHCTCVMRSNDVNFGLRNDIAYFIYLQKYIAKQLGVEVGTYTHFAMSIHFYDRDFDFIKKVAYGTMETSSEKLDIDKLISHKDELCDWIDNSFTTREDFTKMLVDMGIIYTIN